MLDGQDPRQAFDSGELLLELKQAFGGMDPGLGRSSERFRV